MFPLLPFRMQSRMIISKILVCNLPCQIRNVLLQPFSSLKVRRCILPDSQLQRAFGRIDWASFDVQLGSETGYHSLMEVKPC